MTVTDITEVSKTKAKVCIDEDICFALYKSEIKKYAIKIDESISQELFDTILNEVLLKRAKLRCLHLLKGRDYTEHQLKIKLRKAFYPESVIAEAAAYAVSYGYIDDIRYARSYIAYAGQTKSRKQIEYDLQKKGVAREDIEQAYAQCTEEDYPAAEDLIKKFLEKKHFDRQNATYEERQKMTAILYRKGFMLDDIYNAVGNNITCGV